MALHLCVIGMLLVWLLQGLSEPSFQSKERLHVVGLLDYREEENWASLQPRNMSWEQPSAEGKYGWSELEMDEIDGRASTPADTVISIRKEINEYFEEDANQTPAYEGDSRYRTNDARHYSKGIPVYVSLTTISSRIDRVSYTIKALLKGTIRPNRIYLIVSEDAFLLDKGTKRENLPRGIVDLKSAFPDVFRVVFVKNHGPHRKLLPMLAKFWKEDVILITVDDDNNRNQVSRNNIVSDLLRYFRRSNGDTVVALRVRRIGLCDEPPYNVMSYRRFWGGATPGRQEHLLLPTGTGGVLYRPRFFHPVVFSDKLRDLTKVGDDLMFRLACMAGSTPVLTGCDVRTHGRCPERDDNIHISLDGIQEKRLMMRKWKKLLLEGHANNDTIEEQINPKERERKMKYNAVNLGLAETLFRDVHAMQRGGGETKRVATADPTRRRLNDDQKSLYMVFNRYQANEVAWKKAAEFLGKNRIFDFKSKTAEWIRKEREACFDEFWNKSRTKKYVKNLLEERMPNGTIIVRKPSLEKPPLALSCMMYRCPPRIERLRAIDVMDK